MGLVPAPPSPEPQMKAALNIRPPFRGLSLSTFYFIVILHSQGAAKKMDKEALRTCIQTLPADCSTHSSHMTAGIRGVVGLFPRLA